MSITRVRLTGLAIALVALGVGLARAVRGHILRTRPGTRSVGRVEHAPASAPPSAEAPPLTPDPHGEPSQATAAPAVAAAMEEFGRGDVAPALMRLGGSSDLWLRLSDFDGWPERGERRAALIEAIARHPEWGDEAVYEAAIALGLWENDGAFAVSRARNRKRVRRLRAAVSRNLVYLDDVRAERDAAAEAERERDDPAA